MEKEKKSTHPPNQSKKLTILMILEILKKHSDESHKLTQLEIAELIEQEYSVSIDRHTIKDNLLHLIDFDCGVGYKEKTRIQKNGKKETIYYDWYVEHEFTDAELHLLINVLRFSKYLPYSQCKMLIEKLVTLSSKNFLYKNNLPENHPENKQLLLTIEELVEAIDKDEWVVFHYRLDYISDIEILKGQRRRLISTLPDHRLVRKRSHVER
ncbi:MAG: hypothetical protein FWG53_09585 [Clostridiales bacterium]|nr:hypothetical protein [Clostridiales bacterium]